MTDFSKVAAPTVSPPDQHKHVNYAVGMVLGVDDFTQEFTYLSALNQWLARDVIGYGTLTGLQVALDGVNPVNATSNPRITVTAGVAISPQGQLIRIPLDQCAFINDWLASADRKQQINNLFGAANTGTLTTFVVLCYNNIPTDDVPIPGEPCRSEADILRPSRLSDDFSLELRLIDPNAKPPVTAPDQKTEEALRAFIALLKQVQIVSSAPFLSTDQFEMVIGRIKPVPGAPVLTYTFDPADTPPISIPAAQAGDYINRAFRIWALTLLWRDSSRNFGDPPLEACLSLAEIDIQVTKDAQGNWSANTVTLKTNPHRPYLIPLRLLQEWLLNGPLSAKTIPSAPTSVVAAGMFQFPINASRQMAATNMFNSLVTNNTLTATQLNAPNQNLFLLEGGFQQNGKYIVKGTPIANTGITTAQTFEYLPSVASDANLVTALTAIGKTITSGLVVRVGQATNVANATTTGFMVEISQIA